MKNSKAILFIVALIALALLAFALYLQHVENMLPCPLCVIQRYAFAGIALICLISLLLPLAAQRVGAGLATLAALAGAGVASWHVWLQAHPATSCGIDPLETSLNRYPTANWLPQVFKADGMCSTAYPPILGLSIPQWALVWFIILAIALAMVCLRRSAKQSYATLR